MAFIQTLLPFVVLVATNIIIVKRLSAVHAIEKQHMQKLQQQQVLPPTPKSSTSLNPFHEIRRASMKKLSFSRIRMPASVRNAVYTTMAIVASYLICNTLHLFLTVLERSKASILEDKEDPLKASIFYTFFGDSVSALYMVTSAIRIVIYCKCNPLVKQQVVETLTNMFARQKCHHDDVTKVKPTQCLITIENDKFSSQCPSEEV
uniref:G-protein coupled receptors family 1 profile domain-containing protein n=1 Tax=Panagrolaimus davidi TaxID=227884 RepID=A0A914Q855_9BILA